MSERSLEATCRECGRPLSFHAQEERPVRCDVCFERYLRDIDHEFLSSYAELGVTSRRTVAETCLRGLVLESPPARKVLALAIMEQFLQASADLIGLVHALRQRDREPIVRSFLAFRLDGEASAAFFGALRDGPEDELLTSFGLPAPESVAAAYPALDASDARELSLALGALLRDLRTTSQRESSALLLAQLAGQVRGGPAMAQQTKWLPENGMRPDHVASLVLDERRRQLVVQAMPVDEDRLAEVVDAIDCMARAASNLVYAFLTVQDEEARLRALSEGRR
jgi:hypothetical protein